MFFEIEYRVVWIDDWGKWRSKTYSYESNAWGELVELNRRGYYAYLSKKVVPKTVDKKTT